MPLLIMFDFYFHLLYHTQLDDNILYWNDIVLFHIFKDDLFCCNHRVQIISALEMGSYFWFIGIRHPNIPLYAGSDPCYCLKTPKILKILLKIIFFKRQTSKNLLFPPPKKSFYSFGAPLQLLVPPLFVWLSSWHVLFT